MKYHLEFTEHAKKQLNKLDVYVQKMILLWLNKNINNTQEGHYERSKPCC